MVTNPENFENPNVKLIDFGLASRNTKLDCISPNSAYFTMAPEELLFCIGKITPHVPEAVREIFKVFTALRLCIFRNNFF
jgi:hypothetical protein